jgi:hypothetical protein
MILIRKKTSEENDGELLTSIQKQIMTNQDLEILLRDRCEHLDLKKKAFDLLEKIFSDNANNPDEDFLCGFDQTELKPIFDGFKYIIEERYPDSIIRTRIGLYIADVKEIWIDKLEPIGYFELETTFDGEILDDWFVLEKEKYIKDIDIISHFQSMNKELPLDYLKRNHIQYEYVAYISLIGTLFISKEFGSAGRFIQRAYTYLRGTDNALLDKKYLKESKKFLKMMEDYLLKNNLVTDELRQEFQKNENDD